MSRMSAFVQVEKMVNMHVMIFVVVVKNGYLKYNCKTRNDFYASKLARNDISHLIIRLFVNLFFFTRWPLSPILHFAHFYPSAIKAVGHSDHQRRAVWQAVSRSDGRAVRISAFTKKLTYE